MKRNAAIYLRVSSERQAADNTVSIEQQEETCRKFCEAQGFVIIGVFVDKEKYIPPAQKDKPGKNKKVKRVEPSGTRVDRPGFQELLAQVESGDIDAVVAFDSSRIGRHLRVLGALANSLDLAKEKRNGREVAVWEADKNNSLTRLMLSIMITIAQEENETRVRRTRMGRKGTLDLGLWPSHRFYFGYRTIKAERGYRIEIDKEQAEIVRFIFTEALRNSVYQIRLALIAMGHKQPNNKVDWHLSCIQRILTHECYATGRAVWQLGNGFTYELEVPAIIELELFQAVQKALESRKAKSQGSLKVPALLHHLGYCSHCGHKLAVYTHNKYSYKVADGTRKYREFYGLPVYSYACPNRHYPEMGHSQIVWNGAKVDEELWRLIVDKVILNPDTILEQVNRRQENLQENHQGTEGAIERCDREIKAIQGGRQRLINQLDKGIIEEDEFEAVMIQRKKELKYWQEEKDRLIILRDEQKIVEDGLNVMINFLKHQESRLAYLDRPLKSLPLEEQLQVLIERREIVQAICERVFVHPGGILKVEGLVNTDRFLDTNDYRYRFLSFILTNEPFFQNEQMFDNLIRDDYNIAIIE